MYPDVTMPPTFLHHEEVFWVGVQTIIAGGGLVGLLFYTLFTKRMMNSQEESRRASLTPTLAGQYLGGENSYQGVLRDEVVEVTNIGGGAAIQVLYWAGRAPENYVLTNDVSLRKDGDLASVAGHLLSGQRTTVRFERVWIGEPWVFTISAQDALGGIHQLKYYREAGLNGKMNSWNAYRPYRKPRWTRVKRLWSGVQSHTKRLRAQVEAENSDD